MNLNKIYQGESLEVLKRLPDESINCVMTSPPYWGLRDYGTAKWEGGDQNCDHKIGRNQRGGLSEMQKGNNGSFGDEAIKTGCLCPLCGAKRIDNQLGLEPTFQEYINKLCDIFDEVKRVLRKDATCFVNLGDTYGGSGGAGGDYNSGGLKSGQPKYSGNNWQPKCLCQIPSRFAIEMTNRGWILRNEIIWHKPNCMPSSIKDRFTVDFEKIFFFTKSKKYWFETQYENYAPASDVRYRQKLRAGKTYNSKEPYKKNLPFHTIKRRSDDGNGLCVGGDQPGRNKRTVWEITTKGYKEAHFAVFPEELCITPIKAGCPENGVVLDPFMGSGTTGLVARKLGRNYVGIELNPEYIKIAEKRIHNETGLL